MRVLVRVQVMLAVVCSAATGRLLIYGENLRYVHHIRVLLVLVVEGEEGLHLVRLLQAVFKRVVGDVVQLGADGGRPRPGPGRPVPVVGTALTGRGVQVRGDGRLAVAAVRGELRALGGQALPQVVDALDRVRVARLEAEGDVDVEVALPGGHGVPALHERRGERRGVRRRARHAVHRGEGRLVVVVQVCNRQLTRKPAKQTTHNLLQCSLECCPGTRSRLKKV